MSKKVNPDQFRLFIPARELMEMPSGDNDLKPLIDPETGEKSAVYEEKSYEAEVNSPENSHYVAAHPMGDSLKTSIMKEGIKTPVRVTVGVDTVHGRISDGNHRSVVAHQLDPDYPVPVEYSAEVVYRRDSTRGSKSSRHRLVTTWHPTAEDLED